MAILKKFLSVTSAVCLAGAVALPALAQEEADVDTPTEGEVKLAKMLEGRVAGEPVSCVRTFPTSRMTIIDGTAIVVRQAGVFYVNIPAHPEDLDDRDTMVTRTFGARLCRSDTVTTFERGAGIYTGNIFLGDFVPYRRAEEG